VSLGLAHQLAQILRILLDPDSMQSDKEAFLTHFYSHHIRKVVEALGSTLSADSKYLAVEMLAYYVLQHGNRMKSAVTTFSILNKVLVLVRSESKHLACACIRFFRTCLGLKDEFYIRRFIQLRLLDPIIEVFLANGARYNLLNSVVIDLINFIKKENIKELVEYLVEKYQEPFKNITYVDTFKALITRWEQNQQVNGLFSSEPEPQAETKQDDEEPSEYTYFQSSSDDDDETKTTSHSSPSSSSTSTSTLTPKESSPPSKEDSFDDSKFLERKKADKDDDVDLVSLVMKRKRSTPPSNIDSTSPKKKLRVDKTASKLTFSLSSSALAGATTSPTSPDSPPLSPIANHSSPPSSTSPKKDRKPDQP
jgi:hypothetical protein